MDTQNIQKKDYSKFDQKTKDTIKASAIWSGVASIITSVAAMVASYYFAKSLYNNAFGPYAQYMQGYAAAYNPQLINIGALITDIIYGVIGGAIGGWVLAKFYSVFMGWQRKFLGNKLNTFFKLLFWPYLVGFAISLIATGALSMMVSSAFLILLISVVADVMAVYIYAKMMDKAVGKYYQ